MCGQCKREVGYEGQDGLSGGRREKMGPERGVGGGNERKFGKNGGRGKEKKFARSKKEGGRQGTGGEDKGGGRGRCLTPVRPSYLDNFMKYMLFNSTWTSGPSTDFSVS